MITHGARWTTLTTTLCKSRWTQTEVGCLKVKTQGGFATRVSKPINTIAYLPLAECNGYNGCRKITRSSNVERGCCLDG
ncbi:hypothetical protein J6590_076079 [Homalodisca vitripennis]|nr:hypothetical protein J6590_076079 [Homalodisca vitripennis]